MTKPKQLPHLIKWAVEDIELEMTRISRLQKELTDILHAERGVNPFMVETLTAKIGESVALIFARLGSIERREGPPATNGSTPAGLAKSWLQMMQELLDDDETPRKTLGIIVSRKLEELS